VARACSSQRPPRPPRGCVRDRLPSSAGSHIAAELHRRTRVDHRGPAADDWGSGGRVRAPRWTAVDDPGRETMVVEHHPSGLDCCHRRPDGGTPPQDPLPSWQACGLFDTEHLAELGAFQLVPGAPIDPSGSADVIEDRDVCSAQWPGGVCPRAGGRALGAEPGSSRPWARGAGHRGRLRPGRAAGSSGGIAVLPSATWAARRPFVTPGQATSRDDPDLHRGRRRRDGMARELIDLVDDAVSRLPSQEPAAEGPH